MKKAGIVLLSLLIALPAWSQQLDSKQERQLAKQLKKEQQAQEDAQKAQVVKSMIEYKSFVLEAYELRNSRGYTAQVSSNINFVAIDSTTAVLQIGQNAYVGQNGVGGITVEGALADYEIEQNPKSGTYQISFQVRSIAGTYDVNMTAFSNGRAEATISSAWPGRLTYTGYLVPPGISRVYKGMSL